MASSSSTAGSQPERRSSLGHDLLDRRVPQYLAVYVGVSWGLIEFVAMMEERFLLSPHWTNLIIFTALLLLPSAALFIYFHGRKGADRWHRMEKVGIPLNVVLTLVVLFGAFSGKDLGAVTTTVTVADEEGNTVERVVAKNEFRKTVALFVPAADSADASTAWLGYGVMNGLLNELAQDIFVNLRPSALFRDDIREAGFQADAEVPRSLKRRITDDMHVPYFVDGEVERAGDGFRLTLSLHDAERGRVVTERVHEGEDLFALIDSASIQLRRDLDLPARHIQENPDVPVTEHTTSSLTALRHYGRALEALWVKDDYEVARTALESALEEDPLFADAAFSLFQVHIGRGDVQGAVSALQVAMDNLYRLPERYHYQVKGEWYGVRQDFPRMFAVYEMWAELYPEDILAQAAAAQMRLYQDDRAGAIEAYERVLELDPTQIELLRQIGSLYEALGEPARARSYYERHVAAAPESEASLTALAALYRREGDHDRARDYYDRALLLEPGDVGLMGAVASLDRDLGRFDVALEGYQQALAASRTAEQRHDALRALSAYYGFRGEMRRGMEYQEESLAEGASFQPPIAQIQFRLLLLPAYVHVGRADEALAQLDALSAQLQPPLDALVPFGRMRVYEAMERPEELEAAIAEAKAMIEATGYNAFQDWLAYAEGRLHEMRGDWEQAAAAFEREREFDPTDSSIPAQIGRCHREMGNLARAESLMLEALAVTPSSGRTNYELALVYERMRRPADAIRHLERALETWAPADNDFVWAQRAREKLEALQS